MASKSKDDFPSRCFLGIWGYNCAFYMQTIASKMRISTTTATMGSVLSRKPQSLRLSSKLQELVDECKERLLPPLRRRLSIDLQSCLSDARVRLDNAQGTVDSCVVNQKKQEERETTSNSKTWMRKGKGKGVQAERSTCVTTSMADDFRQLALNDPFRRLDMKEFNTLMEKLKQVIEELQKLKEEINESVRSIKKSRKVWSFVLTAISIVVEICFFVLLLVLGAPTVAVKVGAIAGTVIKMVEKWTDWIWGRQKRALKQVKQVVKMIQAQLQSSLYDDLQSIESLVGTVKSGYGALAADLEFLVNHQHDEEEAFKERLKDVLAKFNGGELKAAIISLENKVDECNKKIRQAEEALSFINIIP